MLYADFLHAEEDDPVFEKTVGELVGGEEEEGAEEAGGGGEEGEQLPPPPPRQFVDLEIECVDDAGEEVESPPIRYFFPRKKKDKKWWGVAGIVLKKMVM
jgi:hypothetical protein